MSNIDNFVINRMSSKFAHGYFLVCYFYCKKISIPSSLDDAENAQCSILYWPPYIIVDLFVETKKVSFLHFARNFCTIRKILLSSFQICKNFLALLSAFWIIVIWNLSMSFSMRRGGDLRSSKGKRRGKSREKTGLNARDGSLGVCDRWKPPQRPN